MAKLAIMGCGTLGSGLVRALEENSGVIQERNGLELELKYILVARDYETHPYQRLLIRDFSIIERDPEIQVVVETIGGCGAALEYTRRALAAGKHVVTANKELVATYGRELLALAREKNVNYLFEASVGGAIPVLRPLYQCLAGNQIEEIVGILNGTTNYILTRMVKGGVSFEDALKEAQSKGYAEADPTADVEGIDAGRKICILSDLAWGREVNPAQIPMEGIGRVDLKDVAIATAAGYRVKLLGRALRLEDGRVAAYVAPHLVPESSPIAGVDDVFNAILIRGSVAGEVLFYGRGAGAPTVSALLGDVIDALVHREQRRELDWSQPAELADPTSLMTGWYLRGGFSADEAGAACGKVEALAEGAVITAPMKQADAQAAAEKLGAAALLRVL